MAQWLRLCTSMQGAGFDPCSKELRSYMQGGLAKKNPKNEGGMKKFTTENRIHC